jgi:hypothetical protein
MAAGETETAEEQLAADADDLERLHGKGAIRSKVRNGAMTTVCVHVYVNVPSLTGVRGDLMCRQAFLLFTQTSEAVTGRVMQVGMGALSGADGLAYRMYNKESAKAAKEQAGKSRSKLFQNRHKHSSSNYF